jgi:hypothetical protein
MLRQGDVLVGLGQGQRDRLLQEDVLPGRERLLGHRVVGGLGCGGDDQRIDAVVGDELGVVDRRPRRVDLGHLGQPVAPDLGDVHVADQRARSRRGCPDAAAPPGSDDA